jgi:hypothetical protein
MYIKIFKPVFIVILLINCGKTYAQTSDEAFLKVKKFYSENFKREGKETPIYFNKAENILNLDNFSIPIKEVKILYVNRDGTDIVLFDCDDCIIVMNKYNKLEYWSGFGLAFYSKEDSYEFINLLNNLRERI